MSVMNLGYLTVLKIRETLLLVFIGTCVAIIASDSLFETRLLLVILMILVASAGANGLTNYLDRHLDARMRRTANRALPAGQVRPTGVLILTLLLVMIGLGIALYLHWLCFLANLLGISAAVLWRKKWTCVFPQGAIASCAPVLMGWFAVRPSFEIVTLNICALIIFWVPLHVWSVMIANREDYINARITYFPLNTPLFLAFLALFISALFIVLASLVLFYTAGFSHIYLYGSIFLGSLLVGSSFRLLFTRKSNDAWRLFKISSVPYLGLLFLLMVFDVIFS